MKIIIIGGGAKERYFDRNIENTEIWGLNSYRSEWVPKWDRMFNLHKYENLQKYKWPHLDKEVKWSEGNPDVPFYTLDQWPAPHTLVGQCIFPGEFMMSNMVRGSYHCSSVDWMIAFALYSSSSDLLGHVDELQLHGIHSEGGGTEPLSSRACIEYWCGRLEGLGTKITVADDAHLFDFRHVVMSKLIYGYDDTPLFEDKTKDDGHSPYDYGK